MLTLVDTEQYTDDGETTVIKNYSCDFKVQLAGDSIWDCKLKAVTVTGITVVETVNEDDDYSYKTVDVTHTGGKDSWTMYTDTGFEAAISEALGFDVQFTEQGMQEDGCASMEA